MSERVETLVVGAGVSGLSYAHARGPDADVLVLEASERPGGLVRTERLTLGSDAPGEPRASGSAARVAAVGASPGAAPSASERVVRHELGPEALRLEVAGGLSDALRALGIEAREPPAAGRRRYLAHAGRLVPAPLGPRLVTTPLLSLGGKLRLACEPFRDPRLALDGSVADFVRHRTGAQALAALFDPLVSGIHAGDPEELSMRACFPRLVALVERHGGLLRALLATRGSPAPSLMKPAGGCQALTDALARALGPRLRLRAPAQAIERAGARWRVHAGASSLEAERLVLALPSAAATRLLAPALPELAHPVAAIASESLVSLAHVWRRADVAHPLDGFGYLVASREGLRHLGTLFSSSIDPDACPPTHVVLRTLLGGARRPELVDASEEELLAIVAHEVAPLLGLRGAPERVAIQRWRATLPRYDLGHPARLAAIERATPPGLVLLGNWLAGIGVNHLVATARARAAADAGGARP